MLPRELFQIGHVTVYSFGVTVAIGILTGFWVSVRDAIGKGINVDAFVDTVIGAVAGGLVGARLLYVLLDLPYYIANPLEIIRPDHGGLSFYGGLALGAIVAGVVARRRKLRFLVAADAAAPGIALAYGVARLGCDLYGKVASVPWAVWVDGQPHHPSQVYSALMGLTIFAILWSRRTRVSFAGEQFVLFVGLYAIGRFIVEFSRYGPMIGPFTLTQVVTIPVGIAAFALLRDGRTRARTSPRTTIDS